MITLLRSLLPSRTGLVLALVALLVPVAIGCASTEVDSVVVADVGVGAPSTCQIGSASRGSSFALAAERQAFLANPLLGEAAWAAYACGITRAGPLPVRLTPFDREPGTWAERVRQAGAPTPPGGASTYCRP